ncbi:MAG: OFA family MFS transporter [Lachnospiraceae bacterium]|nr:OFA family MFS transporter [Lachnospiraceae bacterium]
MKEEKLVRWPYVVRGFIIYLFVGLIYAWSIFVVPLEEAFGWVRSDTSSVFSIVLMFFSIGGLLGGFLRKKMSVKAVVRMAAIMMMAGFIASSWVTELYQFFITYGVVCGTGVGICYTSVSGAVLKWFPDKLGTVNGTLFLGYGLAAMAMGWIINIMLGALGWRVTFFVLGIVFGVVIIAAVHKLDIPDENVILPEAKIKRKSTTVFPDKDYTSKEMMKRLTFWKISLWATFLCSGGYAVLGCVSPAVSGLGASLATGALAAGLVSLSNGISRIFWGTLYDRVGLRPAVVSVSFVFIVGCILAMTGIYLENIPLLVFAFMVGCFSFGGAPTCATTTINKMYGKKHYETNLSIYMIACIPSGFLGPGLSGILVTATGSYFSTYAVMFVVAVVALITAFNIKQP